MAVLALFVSTGISYAGRFCSENYNSYCRDGYCNMRALRSTISLDGQSRRNKGDVIMAVDISSNTGTISELHGSDWKYRDFTYTNNCWSR
jgi:hypothetical protein